MSRKIASGICITLLASLLGLTGCASNQHSHSAPASAPAHSAAPVAPTAPPKVVPPSMVSNMPPMGNETSLLLSITVKADGTVGAVGIIDSSGYADLDTAAAESVKRLKFAPATANGKPIDYVLHQTVSYKLGQ
jgi:protein TonB